MKRVGCDAVSMRLNTTAVGSLASAFFVTNNRPRRVAAHIVDGFCKAREIHTT